MINTYLTMNNELLKITLPVKLIANTNINVNSIYLKHFIAH